MQCSKYPSDDFICCNYLWLTSSIDIFKINDVYIINFSLIYALSNENLDQAYLDTLHNKKNNVAWKELTFGNSKL